LTTRIVCVGNELARDDGVGIRVGRVLEGLELPAHVEVVLAADVGLDLIDVILGAEKLILVDATRTDRQPGTVQVMPHESVSELAQTPCCCHAVGLPELLRLAERLDPRRVPGTTVLVGVEAEALDQFGTALTEPVRQALPDAVAAVLRQIEADPRLVETARQRAGAVVDWEPQPLDAYGG
jgi:hydrogenase maturation protease